MIEDTSIIAISGCPGGGKSSLCHALASHFASADQAQSLSTIHYDHFQQVTDQSIEAIANWSKAGGDYDELNIPLLESALSEISQGRDVMDPLIGRIIPAAKNVFFETPLGRSHKPTAKFIDTLIWIDTPLDIALARNLTDIVSGFKASLAERDCSKGETVDFLNWQGNYINNYLFTVRELLITQREKNLAHADIVVDGSESIDNLLSQTVLLLADC